MSEMELNEPEKNIIEGCINYQLHFPKEKKKRGEIELQHHVVVSKIPILATISQYVPLWGAMSLAELFWEWFLLI